MFRLSLDIFLRICMYFSCNDLFYINLGAYIPTVLCCLPAAFGRTVGIDT